MPFRICPTSRRRSLSSILQSRSGQSVCGAPQLASVVPRRRAPRRAYIAGGEKVGSPPERAVHPHAISRGPTGRRKVPQIQILPIHIAVAAPTQPSNHTRAAEPRAVAGGKSTSRRSVVLRPGSTPPNVVPRSGGRDRNAGGGLNRCAAIVGIASTKESRPPPRDRQQSPFVQKCIPTPG